jgi:aspartate oxidase
MTHIKQLSEGDKKVKSEYNDKEFSLTNLQDLMWENVGIVRSGQNLRRAVGQLSKWFLDGRHGENGSPQSIELKLMSIAALLTSITALIRTESRGTHYRSDYPMESETWKKHIVFEQS